MPSANSRASARLGAAAAMKLRHALAAIALTLLIPSGSALADITLLNVSYDPTRELYQDFNTAFAKQCGRSIQSRLAEKASSSRATRHLRAAKRRTAPTRLRRLPPKEAVMALVERGGWRQFLPKLSSMISAAFPDPNPPRNRGRERTFLRGGTSTPAHHALMRAAAACAPAPPAQSSRSVAPLRANNSKAIVPTARPRLKS